MSTQGVRVIHTRAGVREWVGGVRGRGGSVALVPTMGALHAGHTSLVEIARAGGASVALSIFVNPLQFGPDEDFDRYPRDLDADVRLARAAGVDLVFAPSGTEMYPAGEPWVTVVPGRGADRLCGRNRPGHFRGVLTAVAKLFGIFAPDLAVFGEKDYQQLALIRRMVLDLDLPVAVAGGPIVREPDGLALSSRNRYLSPAERERALSLSAALRECEAMFEAGVRDPAIFGQRLHQVGGSGVSIEYGEVVDPVTLEGVDRVERGTVCAIAARVGATRLIDNVILGRGRLS